MASSALLIFITVISSKKQLSLLDFSFFHLQFELIYGFHILFTIIHIFKVKSLRVVFILRSKKAYTHTECQIRISLCGRDSFPQIFLSYRLHMLPRALVLMN